MYFKDILDKYKNGNATEEETSLIEAELNKHEAIEEYLSERYDIGFDKDISQENIVKETTMVKNKVNKKLRRVIISSVAIVFLILFSIFYIISPLINNLYYNPSEKTIGKAQEDLFHDLKVLTELNLPGFGITGVGSSEKLGFGSYNIYFERMNFFNGEKKDIYAKIKRNTRIGSFIDFINNDNFTFNIIRIPEMDKGNYLEEQRGKVISHIRKLNEVSYISSYITFKNDLTMKEFDELSKKYNDKIYFQWVGVRTEDKGKSTADLFGFNPNFNNGGENDDIPDESKYPCLNLKDWLNNMDNNNNDMTKAFTNHYISLLKYVNDRPKAVKALDLYHPKMQRYMDALDYAKKNGVKTYGVLVYAEAGDLLEFINNEKIKTIEIDNVLASKRYIN